MSFSPAARRHADLSVYNLNCTTSNRNIETCLLSMLKISRYRRYLLRFETESVQYVSVPSCSLPRTSGIGPTNSTKLDGKRKNTRRGGTLDVDLKRSECCTVCLPLNEITANESPPFITEDQLIAAAGCVLVGRGQVCLGFTPPIENAHVCLQRRCIPRRSKIICLRHNARS